MAQLTNPSQRTIAERNKFAGQLDDFATFMWANIDMFEEFGAFIINEKKGSLKMYNGAPFQNSYSKPQFQDGFSNLTGVNFNTQTISFTIGVYWISIEDYRVLMNVLHPYEVNMLGFSFDKTYGYYCKLQSIKDSQRYIVGMETTGISNENSNLQYSKIPGGNAGSKYRYYTELQLTFDVVGAQCAKEIAPMNRVNEFTESAGTYTLTWNGDNRAKFVSDLDYPFTLYFPVVYLKSLNADQQGEPSRFIIRTKLTYTPEGQSEEVVVNNNTIVDITLKNISQDSPISLYYDSEHGLVYWALGDKRQVLTVLSTQLNGQRIVGAMSTKQFYWPGRFAIPDIDQTTYNFKLEVFCGSNISLKTDEEQPALITYSARRRTNVL